MNDIKILQAKPEDAEQVYKVWRETWLDTYPNADAGITEEDVRIMVEGKNGELENEKIKKWRDRIQKFNSGDTDRVFVAKKSDVIVGIVAPQIINGQKRVGVLYVLPSEQGQGVGGKLLKKAIEWHGREKDIYLHVAKYNQATIDFYEKNGFKTTGKDVTDQSTRVGDNKPIPEIEMVLKQK